MGSKPRARPGGKGGDMGDGNAAAEAVGRLGGSGAETTGGSGAGRGSRVAKRPSPATGARSQAGDGWREAVVGCPAGFPREAAETA